MLSEHAYLLLETFQMAACLRPEAKALPESLQVYEGPHSPFLSAQVSPATLQGLDLALPPWNAFHPRYPKALMSSNLPSFESLLKCYFFQGGLPTSFQMEAPCPPAFPVSLLCFMCFHCISQPANLFFFNF